MGKRTNLTDEEIEEKKKTLGGRICLARIKAEKTQSDLAKELNCSDQTISNYENNINTEKISYEQILALCDFLNIDFDYLLGKTSHSTKELDIVCDYTGLSEKAVKELIRLKSDRDSVTPALSNILENHMDDFIGIITSIDSFCLNTIYFNIFSKISKKQIEDINEVAEEHRKRASLSRDDLHDWINHLGYNSFKDIYYTSKIQKYLDFLKRKKS